jgi:class 3 adenylate cyclase
MTITDKGRTGIVIDKDGPTLLAWAGSDHATLTVIFTDIVDSTPLGGRVGDDHMNVVRKAHFDRCHGLISQYGGYAVKNTGDGVLAVFKSIGVGVDFALAIVSNPGHEELRAKGVRAGIHVGPITIEGNDVFGRAVNYTDRVAKAVDGQGLALSDRAKEDLIAVNSDRHRHLRWQSRALPLKGIGPSKLWFLS